MTARRQGFTIIELLVVVAIVAILAALIFPAIARAKASAKQTGCLSNMKQIGTAFALYMADEGDLFPYGVDAIDKWQPGIWDDEPELKAQVERMPLLSDLLQPYLKNKEVFRSPADKGMQVLDDRPYIPLPAPTSVYGTYGSSYFYRTELTLRQVSHSGLPQPSESNMMETASGSWHSGLPGMTPDIDGQEWWNRLQRYRYNVIFTDFHAKSVSYAQLQDAWQVPIQ
ncbi:MAG: hypothetical protein Fur0036_01380 [Fimbriimonadaceae bacterium]